MENYFDRSLTEEKDKLPVLSGLAPKFKATSLQGNIWLGYGVVICHRLLFGRQCTARLWSKFTLTKRLSLDGRHCT